MKKLSFLLLFFLLGCEDAEIAKIRKEAENGNTIAQFNLAEEYYNGGKLKQDHAIGVKWYERSAQQGNIDAIMKLANIYVDIKEYSKAIAYIEKVCSFNRKEKLCKEKENIEKDYHLYQLEEYLSKNDIDNLRKEGANYLNKYKHINNNDEHEKRLYQIIKKASEQKDPRMLNFLGWLYEYAYGVKWDYGLARKYYEEAAEGNFTLAYYNLGRLYQYGKGVLKDKSKAKALYEKVSDDKKGQALYQIGIMEICDSPSWRDDSAYKPFIYVSARKYIVDSCNLGYEPACNLDNNTHLLKNYPENLCNSDY